MNDARVLSYILGSVDSSIALSLRAFPTSAAVWKHLETTYSHVSVSRLFDLEFTLANLSQGELDVNRYYLAANTLWTEIDMLSSSMLSMAAAQEIQSERRRARYFQFLMRLRPEFEQVRSQLLSQNTTDISTIVAELVRAETRFQTQTKLDNLSGSANMGSAFAAGKYRPRFSSNQHQQSFIGSSSNSSKNMGDIRCHHCQELGHYVSHCLKRNICTYCKKPGHLILECRLRTKNNARSGRGNAGSGYSVTDSASGPSSISDVGSIAPSSVSNESSFDSMALAALSRVLPQALNSAFASIGITGNNPKWFLDSASFNHMSGNMDLFSDYQPVTNQFVEVANGQKLSISGIGTVTTSRLTLPNTFHVPELVPNLVSVGQLTANGCLVSFGSDGCVVQDRRTKKTIGMGSRNGRNFLLDRLVVSPSVSTSHLDDGTSLLSCSVNGSSDNVWTLWHSRLGHPHSARLIDMFRKDKLPAQIQSKDFVIPECVDCIQAKTIAQTFHSSTTKVSDMFDLVHTDLWGPCSTTSRLGFRYFALFIDHKTRFVWVYFLRLKSELTTALQEFVAMVQTQFHKTVKMFRSDPGGEFTSTTLHAFYRQHGILFQQSCPGVSEQNGLVERKHRHILDLTRAILIQSQVPPQFWVEAIRTVVYLVNRQPTLVLNNLSPFEVLFSRPPDYSRLRVFGCTCFVLLPKKDRTKLSPKTARCVFMGYTDHHKGYLCYDPHQRRIYTAYHVIFQESCFHYKIVGSLPSVPPQHPLHFPHFDDTTPITPSAHVSNHHTSLPLHHATNHHPLIGGMGKREGSGRSGGWSVRNGGEGRVVIGGMV
ncbi:Retrovirus-related Pol polyprotein from transposon RE1 [Linum perenne]